LNDLEEKQERNAYELQTRSAQINKRAQEIENKLKKDREISANIALSSQHSSFQSSVENVMKSRLDSSNN
jgi:hypothetical protein